MPYSRSSASYPPAFARLVEEASIREVRLDLASPKEAARLRGRLYSYIGALKKSEEPEDARLLACARRVYLVAEGATLVASPRDLDPDNVAIEAALGAPSATTEGGIEPSPEFLQWAAKGLTTPPDGV